MPDPRTPAWALLQAPGSCPAAPVHSTTGPCASPTTWRARSPGLVSDRESMGARPRAWYWEGVLVLGLLSSTSGPVRSPKPVESSQPPTPSFPPSSAFLHSFQPLSPDSSLFPDSSMSPVPLRPLHPHYLLSAEANGRGRSPRKRGRIARQ